jgi:hypothetical protein
MTTAWSIPVDIVYSFIAYGIMGLLGRCRPLRLP